MQKKNLEKSLKKYIVPVPLQEIACTQVIIADYMRVPGINRI